MKFLNVFRRMSYNSDDGERSFSEPASIPLDRFTLFQQEADDDHVFCEADSLPFYAPGTLADLLTQSDPLERP